MYVDQKWARTFVTWEDLNTYGKAVILENIQRAEQQGRTHGYMFVVAHSMLPSNSQYLPFAAYITYPEAKKGILKEQLLEE